MIKHYYENMLRAWKGFRKSLKLLKKNTRGAARYPAKFMGDGFDHR